MREKYLIRDVAIYAASLATFALLFRHLLGEIEERWIWAIAAGGAVAINALIKLLMPAHALLKHVGWTYLALTFGLSVLGGLLISDWSILGLMTVPALLGIAGGYWFVQNKFGPTRARSPEGAQGNELD